MASSKYSNPPQPPPLFTWTPESLITDINAVFTSHRGVLDRIVAEVTPATATFETVLKPILRSEDAADCVKWRLGFYQMASADEGLRDASREAEDLIDDFDVECSTREDLFTLINAAYETRHNQGLDGESLHLLEKEWQRNVQNGLLLPAGPDRERFKEATKEMNRLCSAAQKVLDEDTDGVWFAPEELEGVPEDDIEIGELEKGTGENEGRVKVTFKYDHLTPMYTFAIHEATRQKYMLACINRANVNEPRFQRIIELRDEAARLVNFPNHASFKISSRLAKTPERVNAMLQRITDLTASGVESDVAALLAYKKKDCESRGAPFDGKLYFWDRLFYSRLRRQEEFSVDEVAVSQYFPAEPTFKAMLEVFEELLGFVFVQLSEEDRARISPTGKSADIAWHPDASVYSVWDDDEAGGGFRGYLYLDLHSRDNKYSHDCCLTLQSGFTTDDGIPFHPSTVLLCNLPKPSTTKPALLKHGDVITIFHELGHAIHTLAARSTYSRARDVDADFLEAPSQMLENWCWTPSVLRRLSGKWDTGEPLPEGEIARLLAAKNMNAALDARDSVNTAKFDMVVHSGVSPDEVRKVNCCRIYNEMRTELTGLQGPDELGPEWGHNYLTIDHFITGYDAGYYSYLFSEVFSADMFYTAFKADPMSKEQGRRYRRMVLERGGAQDELEYLTEFLGHEPSPEPFFKDRGLM